MTESTDRAKKEGFNLSLGAIHTSLHDKINLYKHRAREIEDYLAKRPEEWGKFQGEINSEINGIFRDIMNHINQNIGWMLNGYVENVIEKGRIKHVTEIKIWSRIFRSIRKV